MNSAMILFINYSLLFVQMSHIIVKCGIKLLKICKLLYSNQIGNTL